MTHRAHKATRKPFAYGTIIEALSSGLYPDKRHILREFIQNAFDATIDYARATDVSLVKPIEVKIEGSSVFIGDKGLGMDKQDVETYRYLGYSSKTRGTNVGFRGIGKGSGHAAAEKIIVRTSKLGVPRKYEVVIDAKGMLDEVGRLRNPPLDEVLEKYSTVTAGVAKRDEHYTFVELHRIRGDARVLLDPAVIGDYISRHCPVPFDSSFLHAKAIDSMLHANVADYASVEIRLNGRPLYKPFPQDYSSPEYERIFSSDNEGAPLEGFCWYCGHMSGGQFEEREDSGLVFRVKNFAVGDRQLTRKALWRTTPERAFWFFGEFHVIDPQIVPSSDRSDFEDNDARSRFYERGRRVAQVLSSRAGHESEVRRLELKTDEARGAFDEKTRMAKSGELSDVLRDDVRYDVRKAVEDLEARLQRASGRRALSERHKKAFASAKTVAKSGRRLLRTLERPRSFYDLGAVLQFSEQTRDAYSVILSCLREELSGDTRFFARVVRRIDDALRRRFGARL